MPDAPNPAAASPAAAPDKTAEEKVLSTAILRITGKKPEAPAADAPAEKKETPAAAPAAEAKPAEEKKGEATPAAPTADPAARVTERLRKVKAEDAPPPAPAPTAEEIAKATLDETERRRAAAAPKDEPALNPEDQQDLELAAYAATKKPDRYAAMPDQLRGYFKKRDELLAAKAQELGGADTPEFTEFLGSEEYKRFVRGNRPGYQRGDHAELRTARIEDAALEKANAKIAEAEAKLKREIAEVKLAPVIEKTVNAAVGSLLAVDDEAVKLYAENPEKALQERPREARIVEQTATGLAAATNEFLRYYNGLVEYDGKNRLHQFIGGFVDKQGELLDRMPEAERTRDGVVLVSPGKFAELHKAGKTAGFATFSDRDIVTMLEKFTADELGKQLKGIRDEVEKEIQARGYVKPATNNANPEGGSEPDASPRGATSRAPGPADKPGGGIPRHISLLTGRR
jgi:hypothetical protein